MISNLNKIFTTFLKGKEFKIMDIIQFIFFLQSLMFGDEFDYGFDDLEFEELEYHPKKNPVPLTPEGATFKNLFEVLLLRHQLGLNYKSYASSLHNQICYWVNLPPISTRQRRSINRYFNDFARYQDILLPLFD